MASGNRHLSQASGSPGAQNPQPFLINIKEYSVLGISLYRQQPEDDKQYQYTELYFCAAVNLKLKLLSLPFLKLNHSWKQNRELSQTSILCKQTKYSTDMMAQRQPCKGARLLNLERTLERSAVSGLHRDPLCCVHIQTSGTCSLNELCARHVECA